MAVPPPTLRAHKPALPAAALARPRPPRMVGTARALPIPSACPSRARIVSPPCRGRPAQRPPRRAAPLASARWLRPLAAARGPLLRPLPCLADSCPRRAPGAGGAPRLPRAPRPRQRRPPPPRPTPPLLDIRAIRSRNRRRRAGPPRPRAPRAAGFLPAARGPFARGAGPLPLPLAMASWYLLKASQRQDAHTPPATHARAPPQRPPPPRPGAAHRACDVNARLTGRGAGGRQQLGDPGVRGHLGRPLRATRREGRGGRRAGEGRRAGGRSAAASATALDVAASGAPPLSPLSR
jgi:hypothetical protein